MSDLDIHLAAICSGDASAFGQWVSVAEMRLREVLRPFAAVVDTEAVLQESLLRVWQVAPRFTPDGKPNALLRLAVRITRNLAIDESRRFRNANVDDEGLERAMIKAESSSHQHGSDPFLREAIVHCKEQLPAKPAEALMARLSSAGGDADEVLAERLGMRTNTFLQNFTRARKLLAECLQKRGIDVEAELL